MIRHARPSDRAELLRMRQAFWPDSTSDEVDALLAPDSNPDYDVLVFEREEHRLGGFVELGLRNYAEGCTSSPVAYLEGIWVDPDLRRYRVGEALCAAAVRWTRDRGLTELASDTDLDDSGSRAFHRAVGFEESGRLVCYRLSVGSGST